MRRLVLAGAAMVVLSADVGNAADLVARPIVRAPASQKVAIAAPVVQQAPRGVAGARWGDRCWVDIDGGHYSGYWGACPRPLTRLGR
jgi:hypothetical protein